MKTSNDLANNLRVIMVWGSAVAAGAMAASLEALRPGDRFFLSATTGVAFLLGTLAVYLYWRVILAPITRPWQKFLRMAATALLIFAGVGAFLYPLKYTNPARYPDIRFGLISAFCALSIAGTLLYCCKFLFEDKHNPETHH